MSKKADWEKDMAIFDNPHKIAVYENQPGNYVKHYFSEGDPLETPNAIGEVVWFDGAQADEALKFWSIKDERDDQEFLRIMEEEDLSTDDASGGAPGGTMTLKLFGSWLIYQWHSNCAHLWTAVANFANQKTKRHVDGIEKQADWLERQ